MAIQYTTTDGKHFDNVQDAERHQAALDMLAEADARIEEFLDGAGYVKGGEGKRGGQRTMAKRAITGYLAFLSRAEAVEGE